MFDNHCQERDALTRHFFESAIPFCRAWKMQITRMDDEGIELLLPFQGDFIGDPRRPALHGGVISALLDTAGGVAAFRMLDPERETLSTIDMRVDYLLPGKAEDLHAFAQVQRRGNKVIVTQMQAYHQRGKIVAEGRGVYGLSASKQA